MDTNFNLTLIQEYKIALAEAEDQLSRAQDRIYLIKRCLETLKRNSWQFESFERIPEDCVCEIFQDEYGIAGKILKKHNKGYKILNTLYVDRSFPCNHIGEIISCKDLLIATYKRYNVDERKWEEIQRIHKSVSLMDLLA